MGSSIVDRPVPVDDGRVDAEARTFDVAGGDVSVSHGEKPGKVGLPFPARDGHVLPGDFASREYNHYPLSVSNSMRSPSCGPGIATTDSG